MDNLSFDKLREIYPALKDYSDTEITALISENTGIPFEYVARDFNLARPDPERGLVKSALESGVRGLGSSLTGAVAAGARLLGADELASRLERSAEDQQTRAYLYGLPEYESLSEQDITTLPAFTAYKALQMAPIVASAFVPIPGSQSAPVMAAGRALAKVPKPLGGGLRTGASFAERRAGLKAGQEMAKGMYRVGASMAPIGAGEMYMESVEAGEPRPGTALALAPVYGLSEALMPAVVAKSLRVGSGFGGNLLKRAGKASMFGAVTEAPTELAQNELEMLMNPTLTPEEKARRRFEAVGTAALVGGLYGSIGGLRKSPVSDVGQAIAQEPEATTIIPTRRTGLRVPYTFEPLVSGNTTQPLEDFAREQAIIARENSIRNFQEQLRRQQFGVIPVNLLNLQREQNLPTLVEQLVRQTQAKPPFGGYLPKPVIYAEGSESQVPLGRLIELYKRQEEQKARENKTARAVEKRMNDLYGYNIFLFPDEQIPLPKAPRNAVAVLHPTDEEAASGRPIAADRPFHEATPAAEKNIQVGEPKDGLGERDWLVKARETFMAAAKTAGIKNPAGVWATFIGKVGNLKNIEAADFIQKIEDVKLNNPITSSKQVPVWEEVVNVLGEYVPKGEQNAVQEQSADEGVLREERPELELQEMGERDAQQEVAAREGEEKVGTPILDEFINKLTKTERKYFQAWIDLFNQKGAPPSFEEVGSQFGVSRQAAHGALKSARAKLAEFLKQRGKDYIIRPAGRNVEDIETDTSSLEKEFLGDAVELAGYLGAQLDEQTADIPGYRFTDRDKIRRERLENAEETGFDVTEETTTEETPNENTLRHARARVEEDAKIIQITKNFKLEDGQSAYSSIEKTWNEYRNNDDIVKVFGEIPKFADLTTPLQAEWIKKAVQISKQKISEAKFIDEMIDFIRKGGIAEDEAATGRTDQETGAGVQKAVRGVKATARSATERTDEARPDTGESGKVRRKSTQVGQSTERRNTPKAAREEIEKYVRPLIDKSKRWKITYYDTVDDAIAAGTLRPEDRKGTVAWVRKNRAYFILDRMAPGSALSTFLHEVGAHLGIENILGDKLYMNLYNKVYDWYLDGKGLEGKIARKTWDRLRAAGLIDAEDNITAGTKPGDVQAETIAYFVEEAVNAGVNPTAMSYQTELARWLRELWNAFKTALIKLGIDPNWLTAQDVVDLAYGAARIELTDWDTETQPAVTDEEVRFSKAVPDPDRMKWLNEAADVIDAKRRLDQNLPKVLTMHQMREVYGDKLPSLRLHAELSDRMAVMQQRLMQDGHKITQKWVELNKHVMDRLHKVMFDATYWGIHPDVKFDHPLNKHLKDTPFNRQRYNDLQSRYNALPKEAKEVYQAAKGYLEKLWKMRSDIYVELTNDAFNPAITKAINEGDIERAEKLTAERDKLIKDHEEQLKTIVGPYFPLLRDGDYIVVRKSEKYRQAEKNGEDLTKLRRNPDHYSVHAFESLSMAERYAEQHPDADPPFKGEEFDARFATAAKQALEHIADTIAVGLDKENAEKVKDIARTLYISSLPEHHALQRQLRREGIAGASENMLRSFSEIIKKDSFYLSRMKYGKRIVNNLFDLKKETRDSGVKYQYVYDTLTAKAMGELTYKPTPIQDAVVKMSGVFHLGMAPVFLLTNMSQPWMITVPDLAGKFGLGKTFSAMRSAFFDAARIIKQTKEGVFNLNDLDFTKLRDPNERELLQFIADFGQLDITQNADMGLLAEGMNPKLYKAMKVFNWATHHIEIHNRIITALAAYRLFKAKNPGASEQAARQFAFDETVKTQIDYSEPNAPYFMQQGVGPLGGMSKIVWQFRKYQQGMIYLLFRNAALAWKGDKEAARTLGYLMGAQLAVAGATGIPVATPLFAVINAFIADDDEKGNIETRMRNYAADLLGPDLGRAVWKGLPTLFGIDVSKNIGMGDLLLPAPMLRVKDVTEARTGKEALGNIAIQTLGGAGGMMSAWLDAYISGEFHRALPRLLRNIAKAHIYATEGLQTRHGTTIFTPEQFDEWDIVFRGLGFQTTKESEHYSAKEAKMNIIRAIEEKRSDLLKRWAKARMSGESTLDIDKEMDKFNKEHPDFRITYSIKLRSLSQHKRYAKEIDEETGVPFKRSERHLKDVVRYAS